MKKTIVRDIFTSNFTAYARSKSLPKHYHEAAYSLMQCRTSALGGHIQACPQGHYTRVWYNSCKHRSCPLCAFTSVERWLEKKRSILLDERHFHVVFTLPHQLNMLWRFNFRLLTKIFFLCVRSTLFDLLADPRFMGALPGVIATLHTWSRTMMLHPHIHCLITGGGMNKQEQWIGAKNGYLLPYRVVGKLFAGRFIAAVRNALHADQLTLPADTSLRQVDNLLNKLGRIHWSVHLKQSYGHGHGVATYLSRYLRGGPISSKRILSCKDNQVRLNYGRDCIKTLNISFNEFIGRFLCHVPPNNLVCVRNWGLYHHSQKEKLLRCCEQLGQSHHEVVDYLTWQQICAQVGELHPERCPQCGKPLICIDSFARKAPLKLPNAAHSRALPYIAHAA